MISQIKVQLNLYTHREKDNCIIEQLGLSNTDKPNDKIREVLYDLAIGNNITNTSLKNNSLSEKEIAELKQTIENLKNENIILKAENTELKKSNKMISNNSNENNNQEISVEIENSKLNKKLLASVKEMDI